jgi:hypothetical protein
MKNILMALMLLGLLVSNSYAGECANGSCSVLSRPVRKAVVITRNIVTTPAVVAREFSREVVKNQPVRRRLVRRSTNCVSCQ